MKALKNIIQIVKSAWVDIEGYDSIDNCPIVVFDEICNTGNVSLLKWEDKDKNWQAWESINRQYTDTYGVSEDYKMMVKLRLICINLKLEIIKGKIWKTPFLVERERQMEELSNKSSNDIHESIAMISQIIGLQLSQNISIRQFISYTKSIKKRQSIK